MKVQPTNKPILVEINGKLHEIPGEDVLVATSQGMTIPDIVEAYAENIPGAQVQGIVHNKSGQAATEAVLNNHLEEATQPQASKAPPPIEKLVNSNLENHLQQGQGIDPGVVQSGSKQAVTPQIQYEGMDRQTGDWYVTYEGERYQIPKAYAEQGRSQNKNKDQIAWEGIQRARQLSNSAPPPSVQSAEIQLEGIGEDRQTGDWYVKAGGNKYKLPRAYIEQGRAQKKENAQIALEGVQHFQPISPSPIPPPQLTQEPVPQQQRVQEPIAQQIAAGSNGVAKPNWINTAGEWIRNNKVATGLGATGAVGVLTLAGLAVQNAARQQQEQDEYERQLRYMTGWR